MDSLQTLQSSPILLFIILPAVSVLLMMFLFINSRRKLPYPPGPKGYPIFGNISMKDQLTHGGLAQLAKRYGGLLHLQMGALHVVAVSTPDMAREVLQVQDNIFSNRPANVAITYLTYDRADMAFANYGSFWRQMRKICVMKLFSRKRAESWASVREEVNSTVGILMEKTGSPVNVGELVFALARNVTYRAAFGISHSHERQDEFMKILREFSKLFGALNIADFLPWLGWIHGQKFNQRLARARHSLDNFIDPVIDEHIMKKKNNCSKNDTEAADTDMVDELLAFHSESDEKSPTDDYQSAIKLTRDHIKAIIMVINNYTLIRIILISV